MRLLLVISLLLTCLPVPGIADSPVRELRLGVLSHDVDGLWSGSNQEDGIDFNAELIFSPSYHFWGGELYPNVGVSINDAGETSKLYGGGLWEYTWNNGVFVDIGGGVAVHNGETDQTHEQGKKHLGSSILFRVTFEAGFMPVDRHRLSLMFDHISNAYLADPNDGLDTLGLRYSFMF